MLNYLVMKITFINGKENVFRINQMPRIDGNIVLAQTTEGQKIILNFQNIQSIQIN